MRCRVDSWLLSFYRVLISPLIHGIAGTGFGCRFLPTCSEYAAEALQKHGPWIGCRLAVSRICRCHPFGEAGFDPVPHAIAEAKFNVQRR